MALLQNIFLSVASVVLFFGSAEGICRLWCPSTINNNSIMGKDIFIPYADPDPILGYRLKKNVKVAEYRFNSYGFRNKEFNLVKDTKTFRIICIGGSTTLGSNVKDDMTYPAILEDIFHLASNNQKNRIEVINAGVFGYHSWHSKIRVPIELTHLNSDIYLIMDGLNDLMAMSRVNLNEIERFTSYNNDKLLTALVEGKGAARCFLEEIDKILTKLSLVRFLRIQIEKMNKKYIRSEAAKNDEMLKKISGWNFKNNIKDTIKEVKESGGVPILVNYPWVVNSRKDDFEQEAKDLGIDVSLESQYKFGREFIPKYLSELANESLVDYIDLQPVVDEELKSKHSSTIYNDTIHLTSYGNYIVARTIYQYLMELPYFQEITGRNEAVDNDKLNSIFLPFIEFGSEDGDGCLGIDLVLSHDQCLLHEKIRALNIGTSESSRENTWRMGFFPETNIEFILIDPANLFLEFEIASPILNQEIEIIFNGRLVSIIKNIPAAETVFESNERLKQLIPLTGKAGLNKMELRYKLPNKQSDDSRNMTIAFFLLKISKQAPANQECTEIVFP